MFGVRLRILADISTYLSLYPGNGWLNAHVGSYLLCAIHPPHTPDTSGNHDVPFDKISFASYSDTLAKVLDLVDIQIAIAAHRHYCQGRHPGWVWVRTRENLQLNDSV
jgi:hypothetical protein